MNDTQISDKDYTVGYVDASPSELLHNGTEDFLCIGFATYFHVDRSALKNISQFKKTRGLKRKLQTQNYIIENIITDKISPYGLVSWNYRDLALKNGAFILADAGIVSSGNDFAEQVMIGSHHVSFGLANSLAWYSIAISIFLKYMSQIAKVQEKKKVAMFLDLLPGDNSLNLRNFEIVEFIINNSKLEEFQTEAIEANGLEIIGYGYGEKDSSTRDLKNDYEFVVTDWILQSFYSLLKYEREKLDKSSEAYQLSKLAQYLLNDKRYEIRNAFNLVS